MKKERKQDKGPVVAEVVGIGVCEHGVPQGLLVRTKGGNAKERDEAVDALASELGVSAANETPSGEGRQGSRQFGQPSQWKTSWQPSGLLGTKR